VTNFKWDERKNQSNQRKHSISFEEATTIFFDTNHFSIPDIEHSDHEDRWITMGMSKNLKTLVVIHLSLTDQSTQVIRIISARKANPIERAKYMSLI